jgi:plasmid stabilization system protein ParE
MKYSVRYSSKARTELREAYAYIAADQSVERAAQWLAGIEGAIDSLADLPLRCALSPESREFGAELRQIVVGGYRIIFRVANAEVRIMHVRHGRRDRATQDELGG